MSDARWSDVIDDVDWAVRHFRMAVRLHAAGDMEGDDLEQYRNRMAFMQAMQSGHTSAEGALERILDILDEEKPSGKDYHASLLARVSREIEGKRPAILRGLVVKAMDETRRFRHVARKNYNNFDLAQSGNAVKAAELVAKDLRSSIEEFKAKVDPEPADEEDVEEDVAKPT